jgi:uncharacterized protein (TIGR00255 family)
MPYSMTGFARHTQQEPWGEIACEIRSVNHRYLEPSIRLPELLRACEPAIREQLRKKLQRGKIDVNFQLNVSNQSEQTLSINADALTALSHAINQIKSIHPNIADADPLKLLQWPGVVQQTELDTGIIEETATALANKTLLALIDHRQREGIELQGLIEERLIQINELVIDVRAGMPVILRAQRGKLKQRLEEFKTELDQDRVEQEMVILANKADVAEELDRLQTHLSEVKHILKQKGPIGRRLDFMMQELNREANTLSSKSLTSETSQTAVSIKVLIEQMREQIQNIE